MRIWIFGWEEERYVTALTMEGQEAPLLGAWRLVASGRSTFEHKSITRRYLWQSPISCAKLATKHGPGAYLPTNKPGGNQIKIQRRLEADTDTAFEIWSVERVQYIVLALVLHIHVRMSMPTLCAYLMHEHIDRPYCLSLGNWARCRAWGDTHSNF